MKKQMTKTRLLRYDGIQLRARREIPFHIKLSSRLILDQLCYQRNKQMLEERLNEAIDNGDKEAFNKLSAVYIDYKG